MARRTFKKNRSFAKKKMKVGGKHRTKKRSKGKKRSIYKRSNRNKKIKGGGRRKSHRMAARPMSARLAPIDPPSVIEEPPVTGTSRPRRRMAARSLSGRYAGIDPRASGRPSEEESEQRYYEKSTRDIVGNSDEDSDED